MAECFIFDAVRSPRGRGKKDGSLHEVTALELATQSLQAIRDRNTLDTAELDDVIMGCVDPVGEQGADIARDAPGEPLFVQARVRSLAGAPIAGAEVDIWQADDDGLYDVQRPELGNTRRARALMRTDREGFVRFRTIAPTAYPVPTDGPVGQMLMATGRHPWRPAHIHFMIRATGFAPLITHIFVDGDKYLDSDVVFGVRSSLIGNFVRHAAGTAPDGTKMTQPFHVLQQDFVLAPDAVQDY